MNLDANRVRGGDGGGSGLPVQVTDQITSICLHYFTTGWGERDGEPQPMLSRYFAYERVSTDRQVLTAQQSALTKFAESKAHGPSGR